MLSTARPAARWAADVAHAWGNSRRGGGKGRGDLVSFSERSALSKSSDETWNCMWANARALFPQHVSCRIRKFYSNLIVAVFATTPSVEERTQSGYSAYDIWVFHSGRAYNNSTNGDDITWNGWEKTQARQMYEHFPLQAFATHRVFSYIIKVTRHSWNRTCLSDTNALRSASFRRLFRQSALDNVTFLHPRSALAKLHIRSASSARLFLPLSRLCRRAASRQATNAALAATHPPSPARHLSVATAGCERNPWRALDSITRRW